MKHNTTLHIHHKAVTSFRMNLIHFDSFEEVQAQVEKSLNLKTDTQGYNFIGMQFCISSNDFYGEVYDKQFITFWELWQMHKHYLYKLIKEHYNL